MEDSLADGKADRDFYALKKVRLIMDDMARKKTTIYLELDLLTATKTLAAYMRSDEAAAGSCGRCLTAGRRTTPALAKMRRSSSPHAKCTPAAASSAQSNCRRTYAPGRDRLRRADLLTALARGAGGGPAAW
jgi:hypothetical protein